MFNYFLIIFCNLKDCLTQQTLKLYVYFTQQNPLKQTNLKRLLTLNVSPWNFPFFKLIFIKLCTKEVWVSVCGDSIIAAS